MPTFQTRDSSAAAFWTERFEQQFMPWDSGGVPADLQQFVRQAPAPRVTLIPGCGSAYELGYLSDAGWDVTAIDFSEAAVAAAKAIVGPWATRVVHADFFTFAPPKAPEFIYERAFLCALPPVKWPAIARRWAALLPAGGLLGGFFFHGDTRTGPPFGAQPEQLHALLAPDFEKIDDRPVTDSIPMFAGKERWQLWRRL
jgi:hypothetical protein